MLSTYRKISILVVLALVLSVFLVPSAQAKDGKLGYVDLRRAFYEYDKAQNLESSLTKLTEERQVERKKKVDDVTKLRDEAELLSGDARAKKQSAIDVGLVKLQEFDRETRQELLTKKNDMFKEIIEEIQRVVEEIGKKDQFDFIFDSRNIMYAEETLDLTDQVVKSLNKK